MQIEWGADEAIREQPLDRLRPLSTPSGNPPPPVMVGLDPAIYAPVVERRGGPAITRTAAEPASSSAANLDELRAAIIAFTGCPLRDSAAHTILPEGNVTARLILIGEAPSAEDDRVGKPFAGPLGDFLDKALATVHLTRDDLLIAPLLPWRPPGDRPPSPSELALCLPFLWRLLALATSPYALILGPVATRALLGAKRVKRGTPTELAIAGRSDTIKILPSASLSQIKRTPAMKREFWADLRKIHRAIGVNITRK